MRRLQLVLLVAALTGIALTLREASEQRQLLREYRRLAGEWGDLELQDPMKGHVLSLDTDDPLHFAWRIYLPADSKGRTEWLSYDAKTHTSSLSSPGGSSVPFDSICRVRFRKDAKHGWQAFIAAGPSTTLFGVGKRLGDLLDKGPSALRVRLAGSETTEAFGPEQIVNLLQISAKVSESGSRLPVVYRFGLNQAYSNSAPRTLVGE